MMPDLELERVVYCSKAAQPDLAMLALAEILAVSDRNNQRDRITGALLVSRGRFFQVLEGAPVDVERTLRRISGDRRHHDMSIVQRIRVETRLFGHWSMVAARITPQQQPSIDAAIDRCHDDPEQAVAAARQLVANQIA